jgi:hypothetical protein
MGKLWDDFEKKLDEMIEEKEMREKEGEGNPGVTIGASIAVIVTFFIPLWLKKYDLWPDIPFKEIFSTILNWLPAASLTLTSLAGILLIISGIKDSSKKEVIEGRNMLILVVVIILVWVIIKTISKLVNGS